MARVSLIISAGKRNPSKKRLLTWVYTLPLLPKNVTAPSKRLFPLPYWGARRCVRLKEHYFELSFARGKSKPPSGRWERFNIEAGRKRRRSETSERGGTSCHDLRLWAHRAHSPGKPRHRLDHTLDPALGRIFLPLRGWGEGALRSCCHPPVPVAPQPTQKQLSVSFILFKR